MSTIPRVNGPVTSRPPAEPELPYSYPEPEYEKRIEGAGWLTFAAFMLGLGGLFGLLDGIVAVSKSSFYVADAHYVFSDLNTWGWILIVVGAVTMFAAFGVLTGHAWARWAGITMAGLQALAQLSMIQAYPLWSLCIFAIDLLVIYALAVYGSRRAPGGP